MATIDTIIDMKRDDLKNFISGLFKTDRLKTNLIRDLEYKTEIMEFMLKTSYCQLKNIETIYNPEEYEEWKDSLTDRYEVLFKD